VQEHTLFIKPILFITAEFLKSNDLINMWEFFRADFRVYVLERGKCPRFATLFPSWL
jgi:hypothetical protein